MVRLGVRLGRGGREKWSPDSTSNGGRKVMAKSKEELVRWIEAELLTADHDRRTYLEEIARFLGKAADRQRHMSWGEGDLDFTTPSSD